MFFSISCLTRQLPFPRPQVEQDNGNAVFPNAMIAGDCVITDLCARLGYLENGKVKIMVVDTFHLFP
jgi:hypothetical protein